MVSAARPLCPLSACAYSRRAPTVKEPRRLSTFPSGSVYSLLGAFSCSRWRARLPTSAGVRSPFELAADIARDGLGVAGPGGRGLECGELAKARARLLGVVVVERGR